MSREDVFAGASGQLHELVVVETGLKRDGAWEAHAKGVAPHAARGLAHTR